MNSLIAISFSELAFTNFVLNVPYSQLDQSFIVFLLASVADVADVVDGGIIFFSLDSVVDVADVIGGGIEDDDEGIDEDDE
jgi:hypothetical protein